MRFLDRFGPQLQRYAPLGLAFLFLLYLGIAHQRPAIVAVAFVSCAAVAVLLERRTRTAPEEKPDAEIATLLKKLALCAEHVERLSEAAERWVNAIEPLTFAGHDPVASAAADIENISLSIASLADSAEEAQDLTQEALSHASQGVHVVLSGGDQIQQVASTVADSAQSIAALHSKSADIVGVVAVIKDVADQTKVLSLNAAIEAARAGRHGRGFSVVADAVRQLADRTAQSTREVAAIIAGIQRETTHAVDTMQAAYGQVGSTSELSRQAAAALALIHEGATRSEQTVKGIAESTRELKRTSLDIAIHIAALAQTTKDRNQAAREAITSAHELLAILEELKIALEPPPKHDSFIA